MDFKPTVKDKKILSYICQNFSCKICSSILMQCVTLSCGHQFCSYCLDMFVEGKSSQCPQCSSSIKYAQSDDAVDQKIDNLIHSCSKPIHKAYTVALNARFQKSLERSKSKNDARLQQHRNTLSDDESKICVSFDDICKALSNMNTDKSINQALKSARKFPICNRSLSENNTMSARRRAKKASESARSCRREAVERSRSEEISMDKVKSLFGIYDHLLQKDNEPDKDLAGGDFSRESDQNNANHAAVVDAPAGMRNFSLRNDIQLTALIKETDDIVQLNEHIQQWTQRFKSALDTQSDLADDDVDEHGVKDELWKSSKQLLKKLKETQSQRQSVLNSLNLLSPALPHAPRSAKLDVDAISEDSDIDEFEDDLRDLQERLDDAVNEETLRKIEPSTMSEGVGKQKRCRRNSSVSSITAVTRTRRNLQDSVLESGSTYVKDNTQFVTQMRKCKDALTKIKNREVDTPQKVKELIPVRSFPSERGDSINKPVTSLSHPASPKSSRPRETRLLPLKTPRPQSQKQQPRPQHPFSGRLPAVIPTRPRTAFSRRD